MLIQNKVNPSNLLSGQIASDLKVGDKKINIDFKELFKI